MSADDKSIMSFVNAQGTLLW